MGDWLNYGEQKWGEMYAQAVEFTDYREQTLRKAKYVAGRFDLFRRRNELEFAHHAEVSALPPAEADALLDKAASEGWSRNDLRQAVRQHRAGVQVLPPADGEPCCTLADLHELAGVAATIGGQ